MGPAAKEDFNAPKNTGGIHLEYKGESAPFHLAEVSERPDVRLIHRTTL